MKNWFNKQSNNQQLESFGMTFKECLIVLPICAVLMYASIYMGAYTRDYSPEEDIIQQDEVVDEVKSLAPTPKP